MFVTPSGKLASEVTTARKLAVEPEETPEMVDGCTTVLKNMNESGVNVSVAGAQPALFELRAVT
jgi:hypothetical protein